MTALEIDHLDEDGNSVYIVKNNLVGVSYSTGCF